MTALEVFTATCLFYVLVLTGAGVALQSPSRRRKASDLADQLTQDSGATAAPGQMKGRTTQ